MATNKTQSGQQYIWEGPLDPSGMPMGMGDSRGITGMKLKLGATPYTPGPITPIAKYTGNIKLSSKSSWLRY